MRISFRKAVIRSGSSVAEWSHLDRKRRFMSNPLDVAHATAVQARPAGVERVSIPSRAALLISEGPRVRATRESGSKTFRAQYPREATTGSRKEMTLAAPDGGTRGDPGRGVSAGDGGGGCGRRRPGLGRAPAATASRRSRAAARATRRRDGRQRSRVACLVHGAEREVDGAG